jgi:hypothetical protein
MQVELKGNLATDDLKGGESRMLRLQFVDDVAGWLVGEFTAVDMRHGGDETETADERLKRIEKLAEAVSEFFGDGIDVIVTTLRMPPPIGG